MIAIRILQTELDEGVFKLVVVMVHFVGAQEERKLVASELEFVFLFLHIASCASGFCFRVYRILGFLAPAPKV